MQQFNGSHGYVNPPSIFLEKQLVSSVAAANLLPLGLTHIPLGFPAEQSVSTHSTVIMFKSNSILEECLALKQRAKHAIVLKGQRSEK